MVQAGRNTRSAAEENGEPTPDRVYLESARKGERSAFDFIVQRYMRRAYFASLSLVGNHEDARDLSQDAFWRAFQHLESFDLERPFYPWFYRILRNLCINHIRRKSRRGFHLSIDAPIEEGGIEVVNGSPGPSAVVAEDEALRALWGEVQRLGPEQREIIVLREFEDLSYKQIAERLEVPIGTVMSRLHTARRTLKKRLEKYL